MLKKSYNVAVVGATGNVGREIFNILEEEQFPIDNLYAIASQRSAGKKISSGKETLIVEDIDNFDFKKVDIALFSAGGSVSKQYAPIAAENNCIVIDNTSHFRMHENVPLIVPEVNLHDLKKYTESNIIANPNCSTIQLAVALKPLHDVFKIKRVVVSTYQSVSGGGKESMDELFNQTKASFTYDPIEPKIFPKQISFNCIPHIDVFREDGYTKEEWKMQVETKKILDPNIQLTATCVRVPVFTSHAEAVNVEFNEQFEMGEIIDILQNAPSLELITEPNNEGYITQVEATGSNLTYVSRLRRDQSAENAIAMWVVSDNLRKGAALNAVQIAQELIKTYI